MVCIDPGNVELMQDFYADRSNIRLLEVECEFTDEYLIGHAHRVGLAGEKTPQETIDKLLPTIRYDVKFESDRIRDADFEGFHRIRQSATVEENTGPLAAFLGISLEKAREIADTITFSWTETDGLYLRSAEHLRPYPARRDSNKTLLETAHTHWPSMTSTRKRRCMFW